MKLCLAGSEDAEAWYLVTTKEGGKIPLCTINLDLLPQIKAKMDLGRVHEHAHAVFADHLVDLRELRSFFYNPKTGGYFPQTLRVYADSQVQVKLLEGFSWVNTSEAIPQPAMDQFLLGLGAEAHHVNRRLAGMAARRAPLVDVAVPFYGCGPCCE